MLTVISKRDARRSLRSSLLDRVRNNPRDAGLYSLSKRKVRVRLGKQSLVLRECDPLVAEIDRILGEYRAQVQASMEPARVVNGKAERRAKRLLHEIARKHERLRLENEEVFVTSTNGGRYVISIKGGTVYWLRGRTRRYVCVIADYWYKGERLPQADLVIAIALTIAYAPSLIHTL